MTAFHVQPIWFSRESPSIAAKLKDDVRGKWFHYPGFKWSTDPLVLGPTKNSKFQGVSATWSNRCQCNMEHLWLKFHNSFKLLADVWTRISSSVEPQEQASQELRADFQKDWYDIWEYFKQRRYPGTRRVFFHFRFEIRKVPSCYCTGVHTEGG